MPDQNNTMPDDEKALYEQAVLGERADKFWKTDLGQYLVGRSFDETREVIGRLKTVPPNEVNKIIELQLQWRAAEGALVWLQQAIVTGRHALEIIQSTKED